MSKDILSLRVKHLNGMDSMAPFKSNGTLKAPPSSPYTGERRRSSVAVGIETDGRWRLIIAADGIDPIRCRPTQSCRHWQPSLPRMASLTCATAVRASRSSVKTSAVSLERGSQVPPAVVEIVGTIGIIWLVKE